MRNIESIQKEAHGVYGFWYRRRCIYIGKAGDIAIRLQQHWEGTHNKDLSDWICAKGKELMFTYKIIDDPSLIDSFERFFIRKYQPITNIVRYQAN